MKVPHINYIQTPAQREFDNNVSGFVRGMCITQRKIVSNIFNCNPIICLCSGKWKICSAESLKTAYLTSSKNGNHFLLLVVDLIRK